MRFARLKVLGANHSAFALQDAVYYIVASRRRRTHERHVYSPTA